MAESGGIVAEEYNSETIIMADASELIDLSWNGDLVDLPSSSDENEHPRPEGSHAGNLVSSRPMKLSVEYVQKSNSKEFISLESGGEGSSDEESWLLSPASKCGQDPNLMMVSNMTYG